MNPGEVDVRDEAIDIHESAALEQCRGRGKRANGKAETFAGTRVPQHGRWLVLVAAVIVRALSHLAYAQESPTSASADAAGEEVTAVGKVGRFHDRTRRAKRRESYYQRLGTAYGDYLTWKRRFEQETHIDFFVDVSLLEQWGLPNGGSPSLQMYAAPSLDWTAFQSKKWGTGSMQIAYSYVPAYPTRQNAADIAGKMGLITPINDYPSKSVTFSQLTYTQTTPDNRWSFAVGQYSLFNFDGNAYLDDQQANFNNFIFTQNGSATYLSAGWGSYVQYNATKTIQFVGGAQATNNPTGETLTMRGAGQNCCAWFVYAQWTPSFAGMGSAQYSLSYFDTPSIPTQGASRNWSLNAVQSLGKTWAIFGRANTARGAVYPIRSSYAVGVAVSDPVKRAATDQIAVVAGYSEVASPPVNPAGARDERLLEVYWSWTLIGGLLLTPSAQVTFDPGLNPGKTTVVVLSARATVMF